MKPLTPKLYSRSPTKPVRPTMAPEVMVLQVSANANWNRKNASIATPEEPKVSGVPCKKKYCLPMKPLPEPNMKAKPQAQNRMPHRQVSTIPSSKMFTVSRVRAKPASSIMKPACMKNTKKAATSVHIVFSGLTYAGGAAAASSASDGVAK